MRRRRSMYGLVWLLVLVVGCSEYDLFGQDKDDEPLPEKPTEDTGGDTQEDPGVDTGDSCPPDSAIDETAVDCEDTGLVLDEIRWTLGEPAVDHSGADTTCSELGEVDWVMVEEWRAEPGWVMNPVVAPMPGDSHATVFLDVSGRITGLDGRDGSVTIDITFPMNSDDGGTPAVGNVDGVAGLELSTQAWHQNFDVDIAAGTYQDHMLADDEWFDDSVVLADMDDDGIHDVVSARSAYSFANARIAGFTDTRLGSCGFFAADVDGDARPELINGTGIWDALDGSFTAWPTLTGQGDHFYGLPVEVGGELAILVDTSGTETYLLRTDGTVVSSWPDDERGMAQSLGDATGDGVPNLCFNQDGSTWLLDLEGTVVHQWTDGPDLFTSGGCAMADLDADGVYELVAGSNHGLFIYDGRSGDTLGYRTNIHIRQRDAVPIVADLDADGSAEILLAADEGIVSLGVATGRWARTRRVWHQLAYDITSIDNAGNMVPWPLPSWSTYNAFRAQPAHDGALPDLAVDLERSDSTLCDQDLVTFAITVHNLGATAAVTGTTLEVLSQIDSTWTSVASVVIPQAIEAGQAVQAEVVFPAEELGPKVMVQISGDDSDCDPINNRAF